MLKSSPNETPIPIKLINKWEKGKFTNKLVSFRAHVKKQCNLSAN